jgi:hypothetical protein
MISVVQTRCSWSKPGTPVVRDILMSGPQSVPGLSPLYPIGRGEAGGGKSVKSVKTLKR